LSGLQAEGIGLDVMRVATRYDKLAADYLGFSGPHQFAFGSNESAPWTTKALGFARRRILFVESIPAISSSRLVRNFVVVDVTGPPLGAAVRNGNGWPEAVAYLGRGEFAPHCFPTMEKQPHDFTSIR